MTRWLKYGALALLGYSVLVGLAWIFQRRMIYLPMGRPPPVRSVLPGGEEVLLDAGADLRLGGWFLPATVSPASATVIVFNGNAGNRAYRAPLARALAGEGLGVLLFDYRGYGGNPGAASESGLIADAVAARAYLETRPDVDPQRIVYFGESLGAAVAIAAAAQAPPAALVLRSPFSSLTAVGRLHYPFLPVRLLLRDTWASLERIQRVNAPLLVIAGDRDAIIPREESEALYRAAPTVVKRFVTVRGAGHNDEALLAGNRLIREVSRFLSDTLRPPEAP